MCLFSSILSHINDYMFPIKINRLVFMSHNSAGISFTSLVKLAVGLFKININLRSGFFWVMVRSTVLFFLMGAFLVFIMLSLREVLEYETS